MSVTPPKDYRQHLLIETPEHVLLDYELAGIGSRTLAALIDWFLLLLLMVLVAFAAIGIVGKMGSWGVALMVMIQFVLMTGYFAFFEGISDGQTPGKRITKIRVIRDTGHAISFADAAARNLMNPLDLAVAGVFLIALHPKAKRLGDMVAGTVVVRDRPATGTMAQTAVVRADDAPELGPPELSDTEFKMLREFQQRVRELPPEIQLRIGRTLAERLATHAIPTAAGDLTFLATLYDEEMARRQGRFGARGNAGGGSPAERLVARKGPRWDEFQILANRVHHGGLDSLSARELPDFAARYREVAADLARAHTYRADAIVILRLERIVAAGHNALYRKAPQTWFKIWDFISYQCPREIVISWRTVLLAMATFILPALGGFATLRQHPELSETLIPSTMIERAEAGTARTAAGTGYVQLDAESRPIMAARIIVNNIRVTLGTFMGGIALGIGALIALAYNGLSLGTISGYFANLGQGRYLWTFVAGHGVLEIFAICVAGAAGLRLGLAIIAPGRLPRSDALAIAGRRAMRMMAATILFLLIAGTIEGLISAGDYGLTTRLSISVGSAVFLLVYIGNGARASMTPAEEMS